jgi:pyrroloquinoline-quinone synthase
MTFAELDAIVAAHDLNDHPFYKAWRAGTLPRAALASYASDYAAFIETIETGWRTLGDPAHAATEREHTGLWGHFREALAADAREGAGCKEAAALATEARRAFEDVPESVGALYAFEAQQPSTARSKLAGLTEHYGVSEHASAYFRAHADDYGERERLRELAARLTPPELARANRACKRLCEAMWAALSGILEPHAG